MLKQGEKIEIVKSEPDHMADSLNLFPDDICHREHYIAYYIGTNGKMINAVDADTAEKALAELLKIYDLEVK